MFLSVFKTLIGKVISVELKNDMVVVGTISSVDQFLNFKLTNISVDDELYPYLADVSDMFIRGSMVRFISMKKDYVDPVFLQDAARREILDVN
ncbi:Like-Sm protein 2 [Carpediemonas membranifera]|uniref:Like-Sm protein 2 n=1 Tax=Carpediemonas membranifera TaxID=201153 RepID=A0A8J6AY64_9EUKA|nr:Like-Sm protein 2 [Carpediemonas membranifera]|eukprot:KAG9390139.1 Like-Sm protein 2 [Carpediemonas membranifera]